ncbi:MAG: ABC transporter substrate-binding protein, partial [Firmicutes bacterium]|nr:ABC transporter substrate-binding protein [Bacillota bacterium]
TADATRSEALRLIQREGVRVLLGAYLSEETMAAAEVAAENRVLLVVPVAATNELNERVAADYEKYKYVFRTSYNIDQWAGLMGDFIAGSGVSSYAFVGTNIRWNKELAQALKNYLARSGIAPVYEEFYSTKEPALEPIAVALKARGPGVVVLGDPGQQSINFVKKARDLGLGAPLFSVGGALGDERVARTLPAGGPLYFQAAAWDQTSEEARRFFDSYREKYGYHPLGYADVLSRDALFVLTQAVTRAGGPDVERLIRTLEQGEFRAACGVYRFDRSHQARWGQGEGLQGVVVEWKEGKGEARWPRI